MSRRLLFVSNGVGEDMIAGRVIRELPTDRVAVTAYPLVGQGVYPAGVALLDPRREMPSAGFSLRGGNRGLFADLRAGLLSHWSAQRRTLAGQRGRCDLAVAVGDFYCLWMAAHACARPVLVATADSVRISEFGPIPLFALRRYARRIFARDDETADALRAKGLPAVALGNIMMDLIEPAGETFDANSKTPVVTLLPGSRRDAGDNALLLARTAEQIARQVPDARFLLTVAPTISLESVRTRLLAASGATPQDEHSLAVGDARIRLTGSFADAVASAWVVLGMAGTAHEQAAGLGHPVVAFPGPGAQFSPQFLAAQRRLLGEALVATHNWREAADAVVRLLGDPAERRRRGDVGRARMGPPGGARHTAQAILELLDDARPPV
jgi:uncharacterized protein (TIGR03492 family)